MTNCRETTFNYRNRVHYYFIVLHRFTCVLSDFTLMKLFVERSWNFLYLRVLSYKSAVSVALRTLVTVQLEYALCKFVLKPGAVQSSAAYASNAHYRLEATVIRK
jgi:hypothetical protein